MAKIERDPELNDSLDEGAGDESKYDGEAVTFYTYDHAQFEVPDDYEYLGDDND